MKNALTLIIIIITGIACDPIDSVDANRDAGVRSYGHKCTEQLWSDMNRLESYGMSGLTHREVYEACIKDYDRKALMR